MFPDIIKKIQQDPELRRVDKVVVFLDKARDSMLAGACLLSGTGVLEKIEELPLVNGDQEDEACCSKDGVPLVTFHVTRSSRNHRSNGIRIHYDELDFPYVVFCNTGAEPLTVDGDWVTPGDFMFVKDRDISDPDVQDALHKLAQSPEAMKDLEDLHRQIREKEESNGG